MKRVNLWIVVIAIVVSALTSLVSGYASDALRSHKTTVVPNVFSAGEVASAADVNENFTALATAIDQTAAYTFKAWAWINADGTVHYQRGTATVSTLKVDTGEYCIQTDPDVIGTYHAIMVTVQGPDLTAGYATANTGWGSDCNPYGGTSVSTFNKDGTPTDYAFGVLIP